MVQEFPEFPAGVLSSCRAPACAVVEKLLFMCCKVLLLPNCSQRLHHVYPTADTSSEALTFPSSSVMTAAQRSVAGRGSPSEPLGAGRRQDGVFTASWPRSARSSLHPAASPSSSLSSRRPVQHFSCFSLPRLLFYHGSSQCSFTSSSDS